MATAVTTDLGAESYYHSIAICWTRPTVLKWETGQSKFQIPSLYLNANAANASANAGAGRLGDFKGILYIPFYFKIHAAGLWPSLLLLRIQGSIQPNPAAGGSGRRAYTYYGKARRGDLRSAI